MAGAGERECEFGRQSCFRGSASRHEDVERAIELCSRGGGVEQDGDRSIECAAENHKAAAKAHETAAEAHTKGEHSKALENATKAKGSSDAANKSSADAHGKSTMHAKK